MKPAAAAVMLPKKPFSRPILLQNAANQIHSTSVNVQSKGENTNAEEQLFFRCLHAKRSNRKHKQFDDGFVKVVGAKCVLVDAEGKQMGQTLSYSRATLEGLVEGSTIDVGTREVEVGARLVADEFLSGRCFLGSKVTLVTSVDVAGSVSSILSKGKGPVRPRNAPLHQLGDGGAATAHVPLAGAGGQSANEALPRFDPTAPGALLLYVPPPGSAGQCAVVVDPQIARALRPYQREGLRFIFNSTCGMATRNERAHVGIDSSSSSLADSPATAAASAAYATSLLPIPVLRDMVGGAILADEMGLGKTLQAIALIWTLLKQSPYGCHAPLVDAKRGERIIIITPSSLVQNWMQELKKWLTTTRLRPLVVKDNDKRLNAATIEKFVQSSGEVSPLLIVSYEQFRVHRKPIVDAIRARAFSIGLLVCDEAHRLKNSESATTRSILELHPRRRLLLTGTPIQNRMDEFFAVCDFANPGLLGNEKTFRNTFAAPIVKAMALASRKKLSDSEALAKLEGDARSAELRRMTSGFLIRRSNAILNKYLPPKIEHVICCQPSVSQVRLYKDFLTGGRISELMTSLTLKGEGSGAEALSCLMWLRKLCNHPALLVGSNSNGGVDAVEFADIDAGQWQPMHSGKLLLLEQLLCDVRQTNSDERCVLASQSTKTLDYLERMCASNGWNFVRLDGSTPPNARQDLVERFNRAPIDKPAGDDIFLFLLSAKAGGVGLNLIGANRLVLLDPDWNPSTDKQVLARVWRPGQTRTTYIYRFLTTGTLEEKIFQRQIIKDSLSDSVMDGGGANASEGAGSHAFKSEDLREVFKLNEDTFSETHDLLQCTRCAQPQSINRIPGSRDQPRRSVRDQQAMAQAELARVWSHFMPSALDASAVDPCLLAAHNLLECSNFSPLSFVFARTVDAASAGGLVKDVTSVEDQKEGELDATLLAEADELLNFELYDGGQSE